MNPAQVDPLAGYWPGLVLVSCVGLIAFAMLIFGRAFLRLTFKDGRFGLNASAAAPPTDDTPQ